MEETQSYPIDAINFLTKFLEMMSQITSAEIFYDVSLKEISNELATLYGKWIKGLVAGRSLSEYYVKLQELEFSAYK